MTHPCPQCGAALAEGMAEGLCPACLLKQGLASGTVPQPGKEAFAPPSPADLNRHFPQLEILELLGQGGMGAVYKARQKDLDRFVALKILPPDAGRDPGFAERFSREARVLAQLSHPNIVAIHDFGKTGGLYWVMMEYVDGMNLRQLLRAHKIAPKEALAIVPQICDALQFAHDEGIVHRDIKPENILLDKKGRVKIADFGLAKILRPQPADFTLTDAGATMGTPHYMAPEQVEKPQEVDHRADIFSLGVVFYEMLTGELPLGKFAPPSQKIQMDVRLDKVVLRSLEKEPDRRYQHVSEVKTIVGTIVTTPYQKSAGGPPGSPADTLLENARRQVSGPAIGLIVAGALNLSLYALFFIRMMPFSSHTAQPDWAFMALQIPAMFVGAFIIYAAFKMMRLERRGMALAAGILVMIVPPACLLGLPIGIWSLVALSRRDVHDAFIQCARDAQRRAGWRWLAWTLAVAVVIGATVIVARTEGWGSKLDFAGISRILTPPQSPNLKVYGTVTDAVTGKPIAGARVDDNRYGADAWKAPQQAWTDANGRYELKTWSEEHTIAASAPGYETRLATLIPTSAAETRDDINLPFVDDPAVIGTWESVDFVNDTSDFVINQRQFKGDLQLKELVFLDHGKTPKAWWTWTKGILIHSGDRTASHYTVKEIEGSTFMFMEWKSGDYTIRGMKPKYYVLKKK